AAAGEDALQDGMDRLIVGADHVRGRLGAPRHGPRLLPEADQGLGPEAGDGPVRGGTVAVVVEAGTGHVRIEGDRAAGAGHEARGQFGAACVRDARRYRLVAGRVAARLAVVE